MARLLQIKKINIPKGAIIHRTSDIEWQKLMTKRFCDKENNIKNRCGSNWHHCT